MAGGADALIGLQAHFMYNKLPSRRRRAVLLHMAGLVVEECTRVPLFLRRSRRDAQAGLFYGGQGSMILIDLRIPGAKLPFSGSGEGLKAEVLRTLSRTRSPRTT